MNNQINEVEVVAEENVISLDDLKEYIMNVRECSEEEASEAISDAQALVRCGEEPQDVLMSEFGLHGYDYFY